jgi:glutathione peroxidase
MYRPTGPTTTFLHPVTHLPIPRSERMRTLVIVLLVALAAVTSVAAISASTRRSEKSKAPRAGSPAARSIHEFRVRDIHGREVSLADYKGRTVLIVNTASRCGFTSQYEGLQQLHERYAAKGLVVLGFPSNDFMGQEPGTESEIATFCSTKYGVDFPMFSKVSVKGEQQVPLYAFLTRTAPQPGDVPWNFTKYLVNGEGRVIARFNPDVKPLSSELTTAVEAQLASR